MYEYSGYIFRLCNTKTRKTKLSLMRFDLLFDKKLYISYYAHILMGVDQFSCNFNHTKTTSPTYVYFNMDWETDSQCGRVSGQPPCTTHYSSLVTVRRLLQ